MGNAFTIEAMLIPLATKASGQQLTQRTIFSVRAFPTVNTAVLVASLWGLNGKQTELNGCSYLHYYSEERDKGFMLHSNDVGIRGTKFVKSVSATLLYQFNRLKLRPEENTTW
jgi:hypothetical protein